MSDGGKLLRAIPAVSKLLQEEAVAEAAVKLGRRSVVEAARRVLEQIRKEIASGKLEEVRLSDVVARLLSEVQRMHSPSYPRVINATGVLLHTNLGRAPLPPPSQALWRSYLALEFDLKSGRRGQRLLPIERRIAELLGCEAALVVNNNAGALLLLLQVHAKGKEVVVSRGQLIEIGGSFRLPDVMAASGARLIEVGCTNKTRLSDYEKALGPDTAAVLVAHTSNYRIVGFAEQPPLEDISRLCRERGVLLLVDQGCGAIWGMERWGLEHEPTVREILGEGADAVCFSGDKLLGGPQAGIVVGSERVVSPMRRHPLLRALRPDKLTLSLLDQVVRYHRDGRLEELPFYHLLSVSEAELARRARRLARRLRERGVDARAGRSNATVGGGSLPTSKIPSWAVFLPEKLARLLREQEPPVVGRVEGGELVLDLRSVFKEEDKMLESAVLKALETI